MPPNEQSDPFMVDIAGSDTDVTTGFLNTFGFMSKLFRRKGANKDFDRRIITEIRERVTEARSIWGAQIFDKIGDSNGTLLEAWRICDRRYVGFHWDVKPRRGLKYFTDNRILNAIEASVANQFGDGINIKFVARERGEPSFWGLLKRAGDAIQAAAQTDPQVQDLIQDIDPAKLEGQEALTDSEADVLMSLAVPVMGPAPVDQNGAPAGEPEVIRPAIFDEDGLIEINDAVFADIASEIWDAQFSMANGEDIVMKNELYSTIFGHQPMLFEFDEEEKKMTLSNEHIFSVYPDPKATNLDEMDYLIWDQWMSLDKAINEFPEHADELKKASTTGLLLPGRHENQNLAPEITPWSRVDFRTQRVTIRTYWKRFVKFPMAKWEAKINGLVMEFSQEDPETGKEVSTFELTEKGAKRANKRKKELALMVKREREDSGEKVEGDIDIPDFSKGDPIEFEAPGWPRVNDILQVVTIEEIGKVISKVRNPYKDFNWGWNINSPIPYIPYGMGEPLKLEDVQRLINRLWSAIFNVIYYNQSPQQIISISMERAMKKGGTSLNSRPDKVIVVEDKLYEDMVRSGGALEIKPPTVPPSWVNILNLALREHDILSRNSEVSQGRAPFSGISGKSLETLQASTISQAKVSARFTENMLERIAGLLIDSVARHFDEDDWRMYTSKYPPVVLKFISDRMKRIDFDATAIVTGGRGANKRADQIEAMDLFKAGLVDHLSTLEKLGIENPKQVADLVRQERGAV